MPKGFVPHVRLLALGWQTHILERVEAVAVDRETAIKEKPYVELQRQAVSLDCFQPVVWLANLQSLTFAGPASELLAHESVPPAEALPMLLRPAFYSVAHAMMACPKGHNFMLYGPAGSGKSTTLAQLVHFARYVKKWRVLYFGNSTWGGCCNSSNSDPPAFRHIF